STPSCAQSSIAHNRVRSMYIRVADYGDPTLQNVGGSLLGGGWVRGTQSMTAEGVDGQSGVGGVYASAAGAPVAFQPGTCLRLPGRQFGTQFDSLQTLVKTE